MTFLIFSYNQLTLQEQAFGETVETAEAEARSEVKQTESESSFLANNLQFQIL